MNSGDSGGLDSFSSGHRDADGVEIQLVNCLVVDREVDRRRKMAKHAGQRGHQVVSTGDLSEALEVTKESGIECLLVSMNYPERDLAEFVQSVHRLYRGRGVYVIGLLESGDDVPSQWLERGIDDFLLSSEDPVRVQLRLGVAEHRIQARQGRLVTQREMRRMHRKHEAMFHNAPDAVMVLAPKDGLILEANQQSKQVLGWTREELLRRHLSLIFPQLYTGDTFFAKKKPLERPVSMKGVEFRRPDGTRCLVDIFVSSIPWGESSALMVRFQEVTIYRARLERMFRTAKLDSVSALAKGIADDLNNALTAVVGNIDLISKQSSLPDEVRELNEGAEHACSNARELVEDLRVLAQSNRVVKIRPKVIQMGPFIEKTVSFSLLGSAVKPQYALADDLNPIEADEEQLERVVKELVSNALAAMPKGGQLHVTASNFSPARESGSDELNDHYVLISIGDEGEGIDGRNMQRVFDPYYSTKDGHRGLGLAISQAIVRNHGGIIDIEKAPGKGTVVRIYIPASPVTKKPTDSGSEEKAEPPVEVAATTKGRVLVMDDDRDIRIIVEKILSRSGFDVYCTEDGREAINAFQKAQDMDAPFDVLLLDLDVRGGMGGKDTITSLRQSYPSIKAILMTGYVDDILLENHRDHGFSGVITKPFQVEKLVAVVEQFVGVRR